MFNFDANQAMQAANIQQTTEATSPARGACLSFSKHASRAELVELLRVVF
jgi:hypothetical protein